MTHRHSSSHRRSGARFPFIWIVVAALVALFLAGAIGLKGLGSTTAARRGSSIEFSLNDLENRPVRLSDYRGHPVLVNLWASWCPPCRAEMPDLIQFYRAHQADGLVLLAVDSQDNLSSAQQFVRQTQMPFPVLFDPQGGVSQILGADGFPSTYFIDRNGDLRFTWRGQISPSILEQQVVPLFSS